MSGALRVGGRRVAVLLVALLVATVVLACASDRPAGTLARTTSSTSTTTSRGGTVVPTHVPGWLGLNANSSAKIGPLDQFASHGIVYDRGGPLTVVAGATAGVGGSLGHQLRVSVAAGMAPDVVVDPGQSTTGCTSDPNASTLCIPTRSADVRAFVDGFVRTAMSVRRNLPGRQVLFEPMNEPWNWGAPPGTQSGRVSAAEYAAVLARLLPAARSAGIPLRDILVSAAGTLADGTDWIPDLYAARPCLRPGRRTCGPIEGWSAHPYGLPEQSQSGIDSLPAQRAEMASGADNVFVTEIGFCSRVAYGGDGCAENTPVLDGRSAQVAQWMRETLRAALAMHRAGWLRALIVWDRGGDAWGMENADGSLTASGRVLVAFARRYGGCGVSGGGSAGCGG